MSELRHVVMFSGGVGSFAAAERVVRQHGRGVTLVFADTLIEDADLYRFLIEGAAYLTGRAGLGEVSGLAARAANTPPSDDEHMEARRAHLAALRADTKQVIPGLVWLADGRTPWEVFRDRRFLGKAKTAHCSSLLKGAIADAWLAAHRDPRTTRCYVGMDWTEIERYEGSPYASLAEKRSRRATKGKRVGLRRERLEGGWRYYAPLMAAPFATKDSVLDRLASIGIKPPRLYALGFSHNNCGGGCVRAGIGHFAHLYRTLPAVFAEWEAGEQGVREYLGRDDIAILRDRTGGKSKPLTLVQLRRRLDDGHVPDLFEIGGCGCFTDTEAA